MSESPHTRATGSTERRVVTVMFCDVVGSTTLAETMDPEDWGDIVNRTVAVMAECVERYEGTVTQFVGDAILALFGAPTAHEDDPYRAIRSALDIVDAVRDSQLGHDIRVRVGINTGLVVVGDIDTGTLNTYSALGDVPNVAARLQAAAAPDTVLVSEDTFRLVANDVDARDVGAIELKGRAGAVTAYEILAARGFAERRRGFKELSSPLVGRDDELQTLEQLCDIAAAGTGRVATVLGEAGVGKSRLIQELLARLPEHTDAVSAVGHCLPLDAQSPYHLVASVIWSLAEVSGSEPQDRIAAAVTALCQERANAPATLAPILQLMGIEQHAPDRKPEALRVDFAHAVVGLLRGLSSTTRPIVLVCEDAHWADPSSADLIVDVMDDLRTMPVVLVVAMRDDRHSPGWTIASAARRDLAEAMTELVLRPLPREDSRELIGNLLAIESLPDGVRQLVLDKAEGNPFFLEELIRMLIERDLLEHRDGRWTATEDLDHLDVPATVQGLLAARVDLLSPDIRRVGRIASVIGRTFPARLVSEVDTHDRDADGAAIGVDGHLSQLESRGVLVLQATQPELTYSFRHALIQDVMYEGLLKRERRRLHAQVAAAIERLYAQKSSDWAVALAHHHEAAGNVDAAIPYLLIAGDQALDRGARLEAFRSFDHAVQLLESADQLPEHGRQLVRAAVGRASAGATFTPAEESLSHLERVIPAAEELGDHDLLASLYAAVISARNLRGDSPADEGYRDTLQRARALTPEVEDPGVRGILEAMMGSAMHAADELAAAAPPYRAAMDLLEQAGRLSEASYYASMLTYVLSTMGEFEAAAHAVERASDLAERSGDPNAVLDADLMHGQLLAERGDLEDALDHTRRGLERAELEGNTFCTLTGNFFIADQQLRLGDPSAAVEHLERSTDLANYCNAGGYEALSLAWLAAARARLGELRREDFDEPLAKAIASGSRSGEAMVRLNRAIAIAGAGEPAQSLDDFERARELFEGIGARPSLARTRHAYAQALHAAGFTDFATEQFREAERLFAELGIQPDRDKAEQQAKEAP